MVTDFNSPRIASAYDELPLWSAMFGLLLLKHVPLSNVRRVLDVGCGTGFPAIELGERLGPSARVYGLDTWHMALARAREKIATRSTPNVTVIHGTASRLPFADGALDRLRAHIDHRATVERVRDLLDGEGFTITNIVQCSEEMRFRNGAALINHHFIKLGFLDGWRSVAGDDPSVFDELVTALNATAHESGDLRLTIPMAYIQARA